MTTPDYRSIPGCLNAYVASGRTKDERLERFREVPDELKPGVRSHLETLAQIREHAQRRRARRAIEASA